MTLEATGWWVRHGAHVVVIAVPVLFMGGIAVWADIRAHLARRTDRRRPRPNPGHALRLAALFSVGAALVHGAVCPEHFQEATIYGVFFLVAATCQAGWAAMVMTQPRRWLLYAGAVGNAAITALWAVTRLDGVPLGPGRGETESIGRLDIIATGCELGIVICAMLALRQLSRVVASRRVVVAGS
jgi:hypothetical protein